MLLRKTSSNKSKFSNFPSNVGSDAVCAFGIGNVLLSPLSKAKSVLAAVERSFDSSRPSDRICAFLD